MDELLYYKRFVRGHYLLIYSSPTRYRDIVRKCRYVKVNFTGRDRKCVGRRHECKRFDAQSLGIGLLHRPKLICNYRSRGRLYYKYLSIRIRGLARGTPKTLYPLTLMYICRLFFLRVIDYCFPLARTGERNISSNINLTDFYFLFYRI